MNLDRDYKKKTARMMQGSFVPENIYILSFFKTGHCRLFCLGQQASRKRRDGRQSAYTQTQALGTSASFEGFPHLVRALGAEGNEVPEHVGVLKMGLGVPFLRVDEAANTKKNIKGGWERRGAFLVPVVQISCKWVVRGVR